MLKRIGIHNVVRLAGGIVEDPGFGHLGIIAFPIAPEAVDILPCLWAGEIEHVGSRPYHGAVLVVHVLVEVWLVPIDMHNGPRDLGCAIQERAREVTERMEEEIIHNCPNVVDNKLDR